MTKTTDDTINDRQDKATEIVTILEGAAGDLECACDCETPADFDVNMENLIDALSEALKVARAVRYE